MRVVAISLTMMAVCLAVELSEEQHENLPDFGDPKVDRHAYITRGYANIISQDQSCAGIAMPGY